MLLFNMYILHFKSVSEYSKITDLVNFLIYEDQNTFLNHGFLSRFQSFPLHILSQLTSFAQTGLKSRQTAFVGVAFRTFASLCTFSTSHISILDVVSPSDYKFKINCGFSKNFKYFDTSHWAVNSEKAHFFLNTMN